MLKHITKLLSQLMLLMSLFEKDLTSCCRLPRPLGLVREALGKLFINRDLVVEHLGLRPLVSAQCCGLRP